MKVDAEFRGVMFRMECLVYFAPAVSTPLCCCKRRAGLTVKPCRLWGVGFRHVGLRLEVRGFKFEGLGLRV